MAMSDQQDRGNIQNFNVTVSTDRDGFLRRTCPSCGRDFKTENHQVDLASALTPQIHRIGRELGVLSANTESEEPEDMLCCPYCSHRTEASAMLPEDLFYYFKRLLMRELVIPMLNRTFGELEETFGRSSRSGSLISIHMEYSRGVLPPRPIHGPEPPDMKIVEFLCCGKRIKVAEQWDGIRACTYCATPILLI